MKTSPSSRHYRAVSPVCGDITAALAHPKEARHAGVPAGDINDQLAAATAGWRWVLGVVARAPAAMASGQIA